LRCAHGHFVDSDACDRPHTRANQHSGRHDHNRSGRGHSKPVVLIRAFFVTSKDDHANRPNKASGMTNANLATLSAASSIVQNGNVLR
jgi:hypothetical protein